MLATVRKLAEEIGPRGTGTQGERAAAEFVADRLAEMGLRAEWRIFYAVSSQNAFPLAIDALALLAVILYPLGGTVGRWMAAVLALLTAPLLWLTIRNASNPLRPFLPKVKSQNVWARIPARHESRQHAVVVAHLDTNRCRIAWQSGVSRWLVPLTYLTLGLLALLGLLYLTGALLDGPPWVWWASLLPAGYIAGTVITLWRDDRTPFSPGAHDNAAGVAVVLEMGRRLSAEPLQHTEVWLVTTGAEETDHSGIHALMREHRSLLRGASPLAPAFVVLEGVGSGELVYLTRQGLCARFGPDPRLLDLAQQVADEQPEMDARPAQMHMEDDTGSLRRSGYQAICIAGRDPQTGTLPHWHRADDTVETISAGFMTRAADFASALLAKLDTR